MRPASPQFRAVPAAVTLLLLAVAAGLPLLLLTPWAAADDEGPGVADVAVPAPPVPPPVRLATPGADLVPEGAGPPEAPPGKPEDLPVPPTPAPIPPLPVPLTVTPPEGATADGDEDEGPPDNQLGEPPAVPLAPAEPGVPGHAGPGHELAATVSGSAAPIAPGAPGAPPTRVPVQAPPPTGTRPPVIGAGTGPGTGPGGQLGVPPSGQATGQDPGSGGPRPWSPLPAIGTPPPAAPPAAVATPAAPVPPGTVGEAVARALGPLVPTRQSLLYASFQLLPTVAFQLQRTDLVRALAYQPRSFVLDVAEQLLLNRRLATDPVTDLGLRIAAYSGLTVGSEGAAWLGTRLMRAPFAPSRLRKLDFRSNAVGTLVGIAAGMYIVGGPVKNHLVEAGWLNRPDDIDADGQWIYTTNRDWLINLGVDMATVSLTSSLGFGGSDYVASRIQSRRTGKPPMTPKQLAGYLGTSVIISAIATGLSSARPNPPPEPGPLRDTVMGAGHLASEFERAWHAPAAGSVTGQLISADIEQAANSLGVAWAAIGRNTIDPYVIWDRLHHLNDMRDEAWATLSPEDRAAAEAGWARERAARDAVLRGQPRNGFERAVRLTGNASDWWWHVQQGLKGRSRSVTGWWADSEEGTPEQIVTRADVAAAGAWARLGEDVSAALDWNRP